MNKQELYGQLPRLILRLFTLGLLCAIVFLTVWYLGGYNWWGHFMDACMEVTLFFYDIQFVTGNLETAVFTHPLVVNGQRVELNFFVNQLNSGLVELITLLAIWPHKNWKALLKLSLLSLAFTILYQSLSIFLQLYIEQIGPQLANRLKLFWEETAWYQVIGKVAAFDKFIVRFWAGFPIFLVSLVTYFFLNKQQPAKPDRKSLSR